MRRVIFFVGLKQIRPGKAQVHQTRWRNSAGPPFRNRWLRNAEQAGYRSGSAKGINDARVSMFFSHAVILAMAKLSVNMFRDDVHTIANPPSPSISGMSTLADRIKEAMAESNMTAAELARATGAKEPSVHKWIHGQTKNLKGKNLVNAALALNVSDSWLADGVGPKRRKKQGWPFVTITQDRYDLLTPIQKAAVEEWIDAQIEHFHGGSFGDKSSSFKKTG